MSPWLLNAASKFFPPGPYPCSSSSRATLPYSKRTIAASAFLSWPGAKKLPGPVSLPQPHQQDPVGLGPLATRSSLCSLILKYSISAHSASERLPLIPYYLVPSTPDVSGLHGYVSTLKARMDQCEAKFDSQSQDNGALYLGQWLGAAHVFIAIVGERSKKSGEY